MTTEIDRARGAQTSLDRRGGKPIDTAHASTFLDVRCIYGLFQKGRVLAQDGVSNLWRLTGRRLLGRRARERSDQFEIGEPEGATATPRPASRAHGPWA